MHIGIRAYRTKTLKNGLTSGDGRMELPSPALGVGKRWQINRAAPGKQKCHGRGPPWVSRPVANGSGFCRLFSAINPMCYSCTCTNQLHFWNLPWIKYLQLSKTLNLFFTKTKISMTAPPDYGTESATLSFVVGDWMDGVKQKKTIPKSIIFRFISRTESRLPYSQRITIQSSTNAIDPEH